MLPSGEKRPRTIDELLGPELAARLESLDLRSRRVFQGKLPGERRSRRRGRSVEFDDFREYIAGDDLRHIDWNVLARLDRLFVKIFREEEDLALHILLDCSASMDTGRPGKLAFGARVAMALAYLGCVRHSRVCLSTFGHAGTPASGLGRLSPIRGRASASRAAGFLLEALREPGGAGGLSAALRALARTRTGRGVLVVLSDAWPADPLAGGPDCVAGLNAIANADAGGYDTYFLHVLSPQELDPRREGAVGGDLMLTDVETLRSAEVTISPALLGRYRARVGEYSARLRDLCRSRGIAYFLVPSDASVESLVLSSLKRGGMLG